MIDVDKSVSDVVSLLQFSVNYLPFITGRASKLVTKVTAVVPEVAQVFSAHAEAVVALNFLTVTRTCNIFVTRTCNIFARKNTNFIG